MHIFKKTKIVATLGPVSANALTLTNMMSAGMDVARLNFSHGTQSDHKKSAALVRAVSKKIKKQVAILQDLSGPKIRIGDFYQEKVILERGENFILTTKLCVGDEHKAYVNYENLANEIKEGSFILMDDGKKKLEVTKVKGEEIHCKIIVGGETKGRRGINLPGTDLKIGSLTEKDRADLLFGVKEKVDFIALSFVRRAQDVEELRAILKKKRSSAHIVAKIETRQAVDNIESILRAADAVMIARGDLAVEIPMEQVPIVQKKIIKKARALGKPVIVATQMLESMIHAPVPTRAEVSDVANAMLDGADAVMLSEETTLGKFPVEAVQMMARIAVETENNYPDKSLPKNAEGAPVNPVVDSVTQNVVSSARGLDAKVIVALSEWGTTARMVARHRPEQFIVALTPNEETVRRAALSFGCYGFKVKPFKYVQEAMSRAKDLIMKLNLAKKGDHIIIVAGVPFGQSGGTNMLLVEKM